MQINCLEADSDKLNFNEYMLTNGTAEFANSNKDEVYSSMLRSNEKSVDNHYCPVVIQTASFAKESDKEDRDKESITFQSFGNQYSIIQTEITTKGDNEYNLEFAKVLEKSPNQQV